MLELLRNEIKTSEYGNFDLFSTFKARGIEESAGKPGPIVRAYIVKHLLVDHEKRVYKNDRIAGSYAGKFTSNKPDDIELERVNSLAKTLPDLGFWTNFDHYAPDYSVILGEGIGGTLERINASLEKFKDDEKKTVFLTSAKIAMEAFSEMIRGYADAARKCTENPECDIIADICDKLADGKAPETFREAIQLMWLVHTAFLYENRYAMALGRIDRFLLPFYNRDSEAGLIDQEEATDLIACTFIKIWETNMTTGGDDVVNIVIGGRDSGGINPLTYAVLEAVKRCNIPGPNLSSRHYTGEPDEYLDACLKVIGTGLGYPALMNEEADIPALERYGYAHGDCVNYCMVGCIENFIPGKMPPWSDGRFDSPLYICYALSGGYNMFDMSDLRSIETPRAEDISSMEEFISIVTKHMELGVDRYCAKFNNYNSSTYEHERDAQPFLSCFCHDCIGRGLDINNGGAFYKQAHGACGMGIATVSDSLAAIEKLVYIDKKYTLAEIRDALIANFEGDFNQRMRAEMLACPKYGNNEPLVDKYAEWFVDEHYRMFSSRKIHDGGHFFVAIASNTANIPGGRIIPATPDGRLACAPLSDAASPMHGMDKNGPTAAYLSTSKPDFSKSACGTVLNQKYSPSMFSNDENRKKLGAMIRVYFERGGQEVQINSVSRDTLKDAMEHPENYKSLVVRVSGFSAYYTHLDRSVQEDILRRTEHDVG